MSSFWSLTHPVGLWQGLLYTTTIYICYWDEKLHPADTPANQEEIVHTRYLLLDFTHSWVAHNVQRQDTAVHLPSDNNVKVLLGDESILLFYKNSYCYWPQQALRERISQRSTAMGKGSWHNNVHASKLDNDSIVIFIYYITSSHRRSTEKGTKIGNFRK